MDKKPGASPETSDQGCEQPPEIAGRSQDPAVKKSWLSSTFALATWARGYGIAALRADLVAGTTLGVMLVPQGMAYAMLAGIPPVYGLYASLAPLVVYALLGRCHTVAIGIVALDTLVVGAAVARVGPADLQTHISLVLLATIMVGAVHLTLGLLRLGFIANLLSRPVIAGFMIGAPIIIVVSQVDDLLGVPEGAAGHVATQLVHIAEHLGDASGVAAAIGILALVALALAQRYVPRWPSFLLVLVVATVAVVLLPAGLSDVAQVGAVPRSLPSPTLPDVGWGDLRAMLPAVLTLAIVQIVTLTSLQRTMGGTPRLDTNRELAVLGLANMVGGIFRSPPVSASFSRSAMLVRSGGRTPATAAVAAVIVALALTLAGGLIAHVPKAVLAAMIVFAAGTMVSLGEARRIYDINRNEGLLALFTAATTLLVGLEEGVLFGIGVALLAMLYRVSKPPVVELCRAPDGHGWYDHRRRPEGVPETGVLVLRVDGSLNFANAGFVRGLVLARVASGDLLRAVVLDCSGVNSVDATAVRELFAVLEGLKEARVELFLTHVKGVVRDTLHRAHVEDALPAGRVMAEPTSDVIERIVASL